MLQKIKFNAVDDVKEFVQAASECEFDVDIKYGSVLIDAKSLMGVIGLDLGKELTVNCHGESSLFAEKLRKWAVD